VSTGSSLIVHILAHFALPDGAVYQVMNNWLPPTAGLRWARLYDLKGTADDKTLVQDNVPLPGVHKRFYQLGWLLAECVCGFGAAATPPARRAYALGKQEAFRTRLHVTPEQRAALLEALAADCAFLEAACGGLMDYSLIVGVVDASPPPPGAPPPPSPLQRVSLGACHAPPLASRLPSGQPVVYYVGLIDFLQRWTGSKRAAHAIKACVAPHPISTVPPRAYARQFLAHFRGCVVGDGGALRPGELEEEGDEAWEDAREGPGSVSSVDGDGEA